MTEQRSISTIAHEIQRDWGANVHYAARPYLTAMKGLDNIRDNYGADSGKSMVLYFLSNASTWRGDTARRIKKELRDMMKK